MARVSSGSHAEAKPPRNAEEAHHILWNRVFGHMGVTLYDVASSVAIDPDFESLTSKQMAAAILDAVARNTDNAQVVLAQFIEYARATYGSMSNEETR